jgi:hypothetical protein
VKRPAVSLAIVALAIVFFAPAIFGGEVPSYRDFVNVFLPYKLHAAAALRRGELPLWASEPALGAPFHADYQAGLFYPPAAIVFLAPNALGIGLYLAFHAALGGVGMERMLARRGIAPAARLLGAIVYAFGGTFVSALPWGHGVVAAWMPWAIVVAEDVARSPTAASFTCLVGVQALELLGGAPESFMQCAALVFAQVAVTSSLLPLGRRLRMIVSAIVLALSIAAVQLVPTAEAVSQSDRFGGQPEEVVGSFSIEPATFRTFVEPHRLDGGIVAPIPERRFPLFWSLYVGLAPLALVAGGIASRRGRRFALLLAAALVLALGDHTPVFRAVVRAAPAIVGMFRYPEKLLLTAHLALAVLAAIGLDAIMPRHAVLAKLLGAFALIDLWSAHAPALVFTRFDELLASAPPAELGPVGRETRVFHYEPAGGSWKPWNPSFSLGGDLAAYERGVWADVAANVGLVYGIGFVADAAPIRQRRVAELDRALERMTPERALAVLRVLGVRFLIGPSEITEQGVNTVRRGDGERAWIYSVRDAGPRVYLASRVRAVAGESDSLRVLSDASFVAGADATIEGPCPAIPACERAQANDAPERSAEIVHVAAIALEIATTSSESALLVVGDGDYPGWRASIDDAPTRVAVANGLVRGIVVPAGRHLVRVEYVPASFRAGCALSAAGLVGLALFARRLGRP